MLQTFDRILCRSCSALTFAMMLSTAPATSSASINAEGSTPALEEIIVTARRQAENLQDTPLAVTAIGEAELQAAGLTDIEDLRQMVPGLQIAPSASKHGAIFVRGVGQRVDRPDLDQGVGQYLNGIYIARQDASLLDAVDVANIQVLRGPQGTLFGKNNTGGAMLISTRKPDMTAREWSIQGKLGNFGRSDLKLSGNIPLLEERAGLRFSLMTKRLEGYLTGQNGVHYGDEDRQAGTARLLIDLNPDWTLDLFAFASRKDERSVAFTCRLQNPDALLMSGAILPGQTQDISLSDRCQQSEARARRYRVLANTRESTVEIDSSMVALTLNGQLGDVTLESISAWSTQSGVNRREDHDGTDYNVITQSSPVLYDMLDSSGLSVPKERRNQYSQELRLSGSWLDERIQYTTGIFLALERLDDTPRARYVGPNGLFGLDALTLLSTFAGTPDLPISTGIFPILQPEATNSSLKNFTQAAFAQFDWQALPWWQLTAGLRYTVEDRQRELSVYTPDYQAYAQRLNQRLAANGALGRTSHLAMGIYSPLGAAAFHQLGPLPPTVPLQPTPSFTEDEKRFEEVTPQLTSTFLFSDQFAQSLGLNDGMLYLTWSKGFKAGGLDLKGTELTPFEAENVVNHELGFKLDTWESRLRINAAIYSMDYENIQVTVAELAGLAPINYINNAGEARIRGAELEVTALLGKIALTAMLGYTDANFLTYQGGDVDNPEDRSGEPFPLVPEFTYSLTLSRRFDTSFGALTPRIHYYWRDAIYTGQDGDAIHYQSSTIDSVGLVNFRLSWEPSDTVSATLFIDNLTDEFYYAGGFGIPRSYGASLHSIGAPRRFGLEFTKYFW